MPFRQRPGACALRELVLQALPCELHVGFAEQRIVLRSLQLNCPVFVCADVVHVKLLRLPRLEALANLLRKACGIGGHAEGLAGQDSGSLMVAVAIARIALKSGTDDIWPESANHPNHVAERDIVTTPLLERLLRSLGEAEIGDACEALLDSVVTVGGQQLEGSDDAQLIEQIASDFVLPAFTAIERELQHADAVSARFQSEHATVLVVRMSNGVHQACRGVQASQHLFQTCGTRVDRKWLGINPGRWNLRDSRCIQKRE